MTHASESMFEACQRLKAFCQRHHHIDPLKRDTQQSIQSTSSLIDCLNEIKIQPGRSLAMSKNLLSGAHLLKKNQNNQNNNRSGKDANSLLPVVAQ